MKASGVALTCLLLMNLFLTIFSEDGDDNDGGAVPFDCCDLYVNARFPRRSIIGYYYTNPHCYLYAVVLKFKDHSTKCIDPTTKENQKLIEFLDKKGLRIAPSGTNRSALPQKSHP